ncbi:hypothetical protein Taro_046606 [Colocasia esculenta]|uniref:Uncharacterized protein n=1 Tax=Colocasia esculenta TaxID=4460 RepID=A0A843X7I5_COLES|nr:hypothetical protein [Colocasia esculenta]
MSTAGSKSIVLCSLKWFSCGFCYVNCVFVFISVAVSGNSREKMWLEEIQFMKYVRLFAYQIGPKALTVLVYMPAVCRALGDLLTSALGRRRPRMSRSGRNRGLRRVPNRDVLLGKVG